jgi:hypothetical protein
MKKLLFVLVVTFICSTGFAQTFTPEEAGKHVGDSVKVCGKIFGGRFLETSNGAPTLLNMGAAYPKNPFTIWVAGTVRAKMGTALEITLKDKDVCVTGVVTLYKEKPEMKVFDSAQIEVVK